jgi:toxin ParE1/3/4
MLGRARPELLPNIRSIPVGNYVVFFRYADRTLDIINVIEGHRDIDALFRKTPRS